MVCSSSQLDFNDWPMSSNNMAVHSTPTKLQPHYKRIMLLSGWRRAGANDAVVEVVKARDKELPWNQQKKAKNSRSSDKCNGGNQLNSTLSLVQVIFIYLLIYNRLWVVFSFRSSAESEDRISKWNLITWLGWYYLVCVFVLQQKRLEAVKRTRDRISGDARKAVEYVEAEEEGEI